MILESMILAVLALSIAAVKMKDLLYAVIVLAVADAILALAFYLLAAPDIAITQVSVVAGLTTMIFIITIRKTRRLE